MSGTRNEVKGVNSYWAYVAFSLISCWEMDTHPASVAAPSLGRLTYAYCFNSRNLYRITGCEHLMQMECCGISLIFNETQYDTLMLCFSHLVLMFREKRTVVSVGILKNFYFLIKLAFFLH